MKRCPNCGRDSETDSFCGYCGFDLRSIAPVNNYAAYNAYNGVAVDPGKSRKSKSTVTIVIVVIAALLVSGFGYYFVKTTREKAYLASLREFGRCVSETSAKAETACNLIVNVWFDAIYGNIYDSETSKYVLGASDFNEAIDNLFADEDFRADLNDIQAGVDKVNGYMNELKDPPSKYEALYNDAVDLYADFTVFVNMALDPSGSYNSYTDEFDTRDSDLAASLQRFNAKLPNY